MIQPDRIIRTNRKTLSICVDEYGALLVRAPRRCSTERIELFLRQKERWIEEKISAAKQRRGYFPSENLDGYRFPLQGEEIVLRLTDGNKVVWQKEKRELLLPRENAREKVVVWLKSYAKNYFFERANILAEKMRLSFESLSVTSAKSRWGSCSGKSRLHFSFRLIYAPEEIIDYVVAHELAHIPFKNHQPPFWNQVALVCPDYRKKRRWLKENAFLMGIF